LHLEFFYRVNGRGNPYFTDITQNVVVAIEHLGIHRTRASINAQRRNLNAPVTEA